MRSRPTSTSCTTGVVSRGLYALLITIPQARDARAPVLEQYLTTYLYGLRVIPSDDGLTPARTPTA
ncbi:hypothetical protein [Mycolicibacterium goodii]|uniref:hypothetical protein n=1 Tax=Mycolicibacterium goodii TaxID=134601 RepID=UPI000AD5E2CF|nr:hypothetical protein [Mycolicibacterium goodii]ULN47538.1 hypothetical protein MI170_30580 [Mycolicibacterium goodii]